MGIPSYFAHILRNHKNIIFKLDKINQVVNGKVVNGKNVSWIHNFYLDCNSIIYDIVRTVEFANIDQYEKSVIDEVCKRIDHYIATIKPRGNIYIAFDGVPPVAKLSQQKNRRYKNMYQNSIFDITNRWDTTNITPGTRFMNSLDAYVYQYFKNSAKRYGAENVIVSGSDEPGEGEHKIYKFIRDNPDSHIANNNINNNLLTVIYGLDADLIMLSLNHLVHCDNIYLYREAPHFISDIDSSLSSDQEYIIDMSRFRDELYGLMSNNVNNVNIKKRDDCIIDYIFICFLLGNDFLPHFSAINIRHNGIDMLMQLYKMLYGNNNLTLIKNGRICWRNLKTFIKHIADNEGELIRNIYKLRERMEKRVWSDETLEEKIDKFINVPTQNRSIERFINPNESNWRWRYYKSIFDIDIDVNDKEVVVNDINKDKAKDINKDKDNDNSTFIKTLCMNYLETLEWTYKYYTIGCQDWQACYRYDYPPLFQDLCNYIPYFDTEMISSRNMEPLDVNTTLAYVLPRKSLYLLDKPLEKFLLDKWSDYYRDDYTFKWAFCRYFWESHVEFPVINITDFNRSIKEFLDKV